MLDFLQEYDKLNTKDSTQSASLPPMPNQDNDDRISELSQKLDSLSDKLSNILASGGDEPEEKGDEE